MGCCLASPEQKPHFLPFRLHTLHSPLPMDLNNKTNKQSGRTNHGSTSTAEENGTSETFHVPNCPCGAQRQFECQLMPNLLGVLDVDKHARSKDNKSSFHLKIDELMSRECGGMNWGALAIYTCKNNCDENRDNFVIVQDSVDGNPEKRAGVRDDGVEDVGKQEEEEKYEDEFGDDCNEDDFDED